MRPRLTTSVLSAAAVLSLAACGGPTQTTAGGAPAQPLSPAADPATSASQSQPTSQEEPQQSGDDTPRCVAADMTGVFGPGDSVYSGTVQLSVVATNTSDHTCTVYGFGGLEMHTGGDGAALQIKLTREPKPAPAVVTLKPGDKAYKKLLWAIPADGQDPSTCAQGASYAYVTMPDDTKTFEVHPESGDDVLDICGDLKGYAWSATDQTEQG